MIGDSLGPAQIAALAVLVQRGLEEIYSRRNMARLVAEGGVEHEAAYYPVVAAAQLGWLASVLLLIPREAPVVWPALAAYLALQGARYWVIAALGRFWTHRIVTVPGAPLVRSGPYGLLAHPNYAVATLEVLILPWAFGAWAMGLIWAAVSFAVLGYKARLEDRALADRLGAQSSTMAK